MRASFIALLLAAAVVGPIAAGDLDPKDLAFFEAKIRPVLVAECQRCHSAEAAKAGKLKAGLQLDTRAGIAKGAETGPIISGRDPKKSLLIRVLRQSEGQMPPSKPLPEAVIADFERWVAMGVPDPRDGEIATDKYHVDLNEAKKRWAFVAPEKHPAPTVKNSTWPGDDVDRFLLSKMESAGVAPVADAPPRDLLRRLYFDLTGLPPTYEEVVAFEKACQADRRAAVVAIVDRLLASPEFGRRFGRHWLDVARYAESNGHGFLYNYLFTPAYRYRDWVIDAVNADMPFDRFVQEQIAGDLLSAKTDADRKRQQIATGFLALGPKNLMFQGEESALDIVAEQIDTVGKAVMGLSFACARCHDHKFDPMPMADYYAMAGILRGSKVHYQPWIRIHLDELPRPRPGNPNVVPYETVFLPLGAEGPKLLQEHAQKMNAEERKTIWSEIAGVADPVRRLAGRILTAGRLPLFPDKPKNLKVGPPPVQTNPWLPVHRQAQEAFNEMSAAVNTPDLRKACDHMQAAAELLSSLPLKDLGGDAEGIGQAARELAGKIVDLSGRLRKRAAELPPFPEFAVAISDGPMPGDIKTAIRGEWDNRGDVVPRGFMQILTPEPAKIPAGQSGRLQLAQWLTARDNPLTARVAVNRVWHQLFGQGIVASPDDFGKLGTPPTHPELLDTLAVDFMDDGWSVKRLVRRLVLTRAYQLGTAYDKAAYAADSSNKLLWRANRQRLDAESARDAILSVAGRLDLRLPPYGSQINEPAAASLVGYAKARPRTTIPFNAHDSRFRAVYLPIVRMNLVDTLDLFDAPDGNQPTGRRDLTTVAPQALFLRNSPWVLEQSAHLAKLTMAAESDDSMRIKFAYRRVLVRDPSEEEVADAGSLIAQLRKTLSPPDEAWVAFHQTLLASAEFWLVD